MLEYIGSAPCALLDGHEYVKELAEAVEGEKQDNGGDQHHDKARNSKKGSAEVKVQEAKRLLKRNAEDEGQKCKEHPQDESGPGQDLEDTRGGRSL